MQRSNRRSVNKIAVKLRLFLFTGGTKCVTKFNLELGIKYECTHDRRPIDYVSFTSLNF